MNIVTFLEKSQPLSYWPLKSFLAISIFTNEIDFDSIQRLCLQKRFEKD